MRSHSIFHDNKIYAAAAAKALASHAGNATKAPSCNLFEVTTAPVFSNKPLAFKKKPIGAKKSEVTNTSLHNLLKAAILPNKLFAVVAATFALPSADIVYERYPIKKGSLCNFCFCKDNYLCNPITTKVTSLQREQSHYSDAGAHFEAKQLIVVSSNEAVVAEQPQLLQDRPAFSHSKKTSTFPSCLLLEGASQGRARVNRVSLVFTSLEAENLDIAIGLFQKYLSNFTNKLLNSSYLNIKSIPSVRTFASHFSSNKQQKKGSANESGSLFLKQKPKSYFCCSYPSLEETVALSFTKGKARSEPTLDSEVSQLALLPLAFPVQPEEPKDKKQRKNERLLKHPKFITGLQSLESKFKPFPTLFEKEKQLIYFKKPLLGSWLIHSRHHYNRRRACNLNYRLQAGVLKAVRNLAQRRLTNIPQKAQLYTVIRSPHVFKKTREQFAAQQYKRVIKLDFTSVTALRLLTDTLVLLKLPAEIKVITHIT